MSAEGAHWVTPEHLREWFKHLRRAQLWKYRSVCVWREVWEENWSHWWRQIGIVRALVLQNSMPETQLWNFVTQDGSIKQLFQSSLSSILHFSLALSSLFFFLFGQNGGLTPLIGGSSNTIDWKRSSMYKLAKNATQGSGKRNSWKKKF